ncbi:MAG: thioredoxin domain-containing protein [Candidatus Aminicenantes bacterium]|nr:thioredoxin domain-containing protein [Candidatus Aminicenantes bacterium]
MRKHNRLIHEKSPYLLQHASNPVDWYPWGEEAFKKALRENKPIFLSIGYATCHWCHVMEKESFEDPVVAGLLNQFFIAVKVDREERPDIDQIYIKVCQFMTGTGGWPLTIILTPEKKPFFAGTYIPRSARFGRPGLLELLPHIQALWKKQPEKIVQSADSITSSLQKKKQISASKKPGLHLLKQAYENLAGVFDEKRGGFGREPKFPSASKLLFLLRFGKRMNNRIAVGMVEKTLQEMQMGGIFDHIGGGFHRYATDARWLVPHFEKMLYDQALLAMAYTEAYQVTKNFVFRKTAWETLNYVLSDMTSPESAFYSAEDADSEGEEGKYYLWSLLQARNALKDTPEQLKLAVTVFSIEEKGNFSDEATGLLTGKNILHLKRPLEEWSRYFNMSLQELEKRLKKIKGKLQASRSKRIHPMMDDKILTDWNGLMIAALAKSAAVFEDHNYKKAAENAAAFILKNMHSKHGGLFHRFRENEAGIEAFLDDYAFFTWGLLELYGCTFKEKYLQTAEELTQYILDHFWDEKNGGFYFSPDSGEKLIFREKTAYDGVYPSGNSVAVMNLLRLGRLLSRPDWEGKASQALDAFLPEIQSFPEAFLHMLSAVDLYLGPTQEIIISGRLDSSAAQEGLRFLRQGYFPRNIIIGLPPVKEPSTLFSDFSRKYRSIEGKTTFYVCRDFSCQKPTTDPEEMKKQCS